MTFQTSHRPHNLPELSVVVILVAGFAFQGSEVKDGPVSRRRRMASRARDCNMRAVEWKPRILMADQREQRRLIPIFCVTLGAIVLVLCTKFSLMVVSVAIGAPIVRHSQNHPPFDLGISSVALLALYIGMFPAQSEIREIMVELQPPCLMPARGYMT